MPAEWERQTFVQLTLPHSGTDWARCGLLAEAQSVFRSIAEAIAPREAILAVAPEESLAREVLDDIPAKIVICPTDDTWARDHAFISLVSDRPDEPCRLLDFQFNAWGGKFPHENDNAINSHTRTAIHGQYESQLDFILEGGSIESDGRGTVFTTTCCLTAQGRNNLSKAEIEAELLKRLCAKRIVWIEHGGIAGDDTDGHIDMLVRIAPDDTLLYHKPQDPADAKYDELGLMEEELRLLRTIDGRPYRLLPLTAPDATLQGLPASYANFLVINNAVLVPSYGDAVHDKAAADMIAEAFHRQAVQIDCRTLIRQGGSLHCSTMQGYADLRED